MSSFESHYLREMFGDTTPDGRAADAIATEEQLKLAKACLTIAAADGELSKAEFDYFIGMTLALGRALPPQAIEDLRKFDAKSAKIEDLVSPEMKPFARGFLYGAIKTARADGYHEKEATAVRKTAKLLGIDDSIVGALEALVETEASVRQMRLSLLFPVRK